MSLDGLLIGYDVHDAEWFVEFTPDDDPRFGYDSKPIRVSVEDLVYMVTEVLDHAPTALRETSATWQIVAK